jgi:hypothetical protein
MVARFLYGARTFAALCLTGCGFIYPDLRLQRHVSPSEVVGKWTLTKDSLDDIRSEGHDQNPIKGEHTDFTIEFSEDGRVVYRSLLQEPTRKVERLGRWEIKPHYKNNNTSILTLVFDDDSQYHHSLEFTEADGKLVIWEYFGDPDSFRLAEYSK